MLGLDSLAPLQRYAAVHQVDAVALSHLHADHFIDMCSFWVARKWSPEGTLLRRAGARLLGDTGPCPALTELARSADVLLCEAGFPELPISRRTCTCAAARPASTRPRPGPASGRA